MFGSFTAAAAANENTATIWQRINDYANAWAASTARAVYGPSVTDAQIADRAQQLMGHVTIMDVNNYRALAGQYERARQVATTQQSNAQFAADSIFVAPWSRLAQTGGAVREYRANVSFSSNIIGRGGRRLEETRAFVIGPTLTTPDDLIAAAKSWYEKLPYNTQINDVQVTDFALEAI